MSKIFVLGYNKTGTKSLSEALRILNYKVWDTGGGGALLEEVYQNMKDGNKVLKGYEDYEVFIDYPIYDPIVFPHLLDENPGAKFISLTRNLDDYVESVLRDKIKRLRDGIVDSWNWLGIGGESVFFNYPRYQKEWIKSKTDFQHQSNLYWLHKKTSPLHTLHLDITTGDGWDKLCKFLNKDIPDVEFPHLNRSKK
jgi:hypothetical protein|tara:strand:- start:2933 stop:3520 length:588 start_codon:yes stop_codon:yes gene_type:complete